jgi:hypothetical protein
MARVDRVLLFENLLLLMFVVAVPFTTATLADFIQSPSAADARAAVVLLYGMSDIGRGADLAAAHPGRYRPAYGLLHARRDPGGADGRSSDRWPFRSRRWQLAAVRGYLGFGRPRRTAPGTPAFFFGHAALHSVRLVGVEREFQARMPHRAARADRLGLGYLWHGTPAGGDRKEKVGFGSGRRPPGASRRPGPPAERSSADRRPAPSGPSLEALRASGPGLVWRGGQVHGPELARHAGAVPSPEPAMLRRYPAFGRQPG